MSARASPDDRAIALAAALAMGRNPARAPSPEVPVALPWLDAVVSPEDSPPTEWLRSEGALQDLPERFWSGDYIQLDTGDINQYLEPRPTWTPFEHPDFGTPAERRERLPGEDATQIVRLMMGRANDGR